MDKADLELARRNALEELSSIGNSYDIENLNSLTDGEAFQFCESTKTIRAKGSYIAIPLGFVVYAIIILIVRKIGYEILELDGMFVLIIFLASFYFADKIVKHLIRIYLVNKLTKLTLAVIADKLDKSR